jgi:hypothetical protein
LELFFCLLVPYVTFIWFTSPIGGALTPYKTPFECSNSYDNTLIFHVNEETAFGSAIRISPSG